MSKHTSFFNLPNVVCNDIFAHWIESKDLVHLDTAMMNHYHRNLFLEMLNDKQFVLMGSEKLVLSSYLYWLGHRRLKVNNVALVTSFLEESDHISRIDLSKLESLSFRNSCGTGKCKPKELTLFRRLLSFTSFKSDSYMTLFIRCNNLKHVDFGDEAHSSFGKIGMFCAKLQSVRAVHCRGLNDTAIESIAQHCRENIRTIVLRACDQITSASVYAIAENCPNLTHVDLSYGSSLSERCLIQLAEKCPKLEYLNFEGLINISDKVIAAVARTCRSLAYFNIDYYKGMSHEGIDPVALQLVAEGCTGIQDFIAPDFHYKVRQGKAHLKLKGVYTRLPKLRGILLNSPPTVAHFHASGCKYFNDDCLLIACERYAAHLRGLAMAGCEDVTDAGLALVAEHCRGLEILDCGKNDDITDVGIVAVAQQCTALHSVVLKKCPLLSDAGVGALAAGLSALRHLDVSHCATVTDAVLRCLQEQAPRLRELDVTNCQRVSPAAVEALTSARPELVCYKFKERVSQ